jgi:hypothetical protein
MAQLKKKKSPTVPCTLSLYFKDQMLNSKNKMLIQETLMYSRYGKPSLYGLIGGTACPLSAITELSGIHKSTHRIVELSKNTTPQDTWPILTYGAEPFLRRCQLCSPSRTFQ